MPELIRPESSAAPACTIFSSTMARTSPRSSRRYAAVAGGIGKARGDQRRRRVRIRLHVAQPQSAFARKAAAYRRRGPSAARHRAGIAPRQRCERVAGAFLFALACESQADRREQRLDFIGLMPGHDDNVVRRRDRARRRHHVLHQRRVRRRDAAPWRVWIACGCPVPRPE